jgi:NTE family protein
MQRSLSERTPAGGKAQAFLRLPEARTIALVLALLAGLGGASVVAAQDAPLAAPPGMIEEGASQTTREASQGDTGCEVGVALSGGGARGFAHIGVLQALEEAGIPIQCVAGTSMGSMIGALYASGYSIEEIRNLAATTDWYRIFMKPLRGPVTPKWHRLHDTRPLADLPFDFWSLELPQSMLPDQQLNEMLMRLFASPNFTARGDFDNLPIPFRAIATDLTNAERVVLSSGDLSLAVRASNSLPLAFPPVPVEGRILVDGGLMDNLPVGVVRDMGARLVLAIDISSPPVDIARTRDIINSAYSITDVLRAQASSTYSEPADVLIKPDLHGHYYTDYSNWEQLVAWGYEEGTAAAREIRARMAEMGIASDDGSSNPPGSPPRADFLEGQRVAGIRVRGNNRIPEGRISRELGVAVGDPFLLERALRGIDRLYSTGFFEFLWLECQSDENDMVVLVIDVEETVGELGLGANYNEDHRMFGFARWRLRNILGSRQQFQVDVFGGDRLSGLDLRLSANRLMTTGIGYALRGWLREDKPRLFEDGEYIDRASFVRQGGALGGVIPLTRAGRLRFDYVVENVEVRERAGVPFEPVTNRLRRVDTAFTWNSLDDLDAPTRGLAATFDLQKSSPSLGASVEYLKAELRLEVAAPIGSRSAVHFDLMGGLSWDDLPVHEYFMIGGPTLMPGYNREEFWGSQALATSAGYSFQFTRLFHLTVRGGGGSVWQSRDEIDLRSMRWGGGAGLQYLTPFGPVGGGVGVNQDGKAEVYFWVGYQ